MQRTLQATAALTGGRVPGCQHAALARAAAGARAINRCCAWVDKLVHVQPKLREGPLFGTCLASVTASSAATVEVQPQEATPRRRFLGSETCRDASPEPGHEQPAAHRREQFHCQPVPKRIKRPDKSSEELAVCRPKPEPAMLPATADATLLCRLKADAEPRRSLPDTRSPGKQASPSPVQVTPHCERQPVRRIPVRPADPPSNGTRRAPVPDPRPLCEWRERVTARASRRLTPAPAPVRDCRGIEPIEQKDFPKPSTAPPEMSPVPPAAPDPWCESLQGPVAPAALLAEIVECTTPRQAEATSPAQPHPGSGKAMPAFEHAGPARTDPAPISPWASMRDGRFPEAPATNAPCETKTDFGAPAQTRPPGADDGFGDPEHPSGIVPAQLAVTLPPLRPPPNNATPYQPVAASLIRRGTTEEASAHNANDLDIFEARLQRILSEEARRHGIDV